jgi:ABC-type nitrate/sulfonate/bicarbonate transport system permease component
MSDAMATTTPSRDDSVPLTIKGVPQKRGATLYRKNRQLILGVAGILIFIAIWQLLFSVGVLNPVLVGSPLGTLQALVNLLFINGTLWSDIGASGLEFALGFAIGVILGIVLGLIIGRFRFIDEMSDPLVSAFYATPYVAFLPVIMLTFGISLTSKVIIVMWAVFFPVLINTTAGVKNTSREFITLAQSFRTSRLRVFTEILWPSAIPYVLAGLRQAIGRGLVGVLVAELFFSNNGIGFFISKASGSYRMNDAFAAIVITAIAGVALVRIVGFIEGRLAIRWGLATKG